MRLLGWMPVATSARSRSARAVTRGCRTGGGVVGSQPIAFDGRALLISPLEPPLTKFYELRDKLVYRQHTHEISVE